MLNARWAAARDYLNGRVDASTKRRAILILDIKALRPTTIPTGQPMDLANMRANGVRSLAWPCLKC